MGNEQMNTTDTQATVSGQRSLNSPSQMTPIQSTKGQIFAQECRQSHPKWHAWLAADLITLILA